MARNDVVLSQTMFVQDKFGYVVVNISNCLSKLVKNILLFHLKYMCSFFSLNIYILYIMVEYFNKKYLKPMSKTYKNDLSSNLCYLGSVQTYCYLGM